MDLLKFPRYTDDPNPENELPLELYRCRFHGAGTVGETV